MIEPIMYFSIGFLVAALIALLFFPLVHNRAVRLTMRRLEAATPLTIAEIRADKDQLRAEFAMATRRLEMNVEQMKGKTTAQLAELGKKTDAINQLKRELGEKTATIFALEERDKTLIEQMRASEEEFELKSSSLRETERALAEKEAELSKLIAELGDQSISADSQRVELAALRTQVEAMKIERRRVRAHHQGHRGTAHARAQRLRRGDERLDRCARQARRRSTRARADLETAARGADHRSRSFSTSAFRNWKPASAIRADSSPSATTRSSGCAAKAKPRARARAICAANWRTRAEQQRGGREIQVRHRPARSAARRRDRGAHQAAGRDRDA